jgi:hypothetical protein
MSRPLYPRGEKRSYPLDRKIGGYQNRPGIYPCRNSNSTCPTRGLVSIPTFIPAPFNPGTSRQMTAPHAATSSQVLLLEIWTMVKKCTTFAGSFPCVFHCLCSVRLRCILLILRQRIGLSFTKLLPTDLVFRTEIMNEFLFCETWQRNCNVVHYTLAKKEMTREEIPTR